MRDGPWPCTAKDPCGVDMPGAQVGLDTVAAGRNSNAQSVDLASFRITLQVLATSS